MYILSEIDVGTNNSIKVLMRCIQFKQYGSTIIALV